jgi:hypothetical protein
MLAAYEQTKLGIAVAGACAPKATSVHNHTSNLNSLQPSSPAAASTATPGTRPTLRPCFSSYFPKAFLATVIGKCGATVYGQYHWPAGVFLRAQNSPPQRFEVHVSNPPSPRVCVAWDRTRLLPKRNIARILTCILRPIIAAVVRSPCGRS